MKTRSFLRREEYRRLSKLSIDGKILDIGGSKKSGYHELIKGTHTYTVANIDEAYGTDIIFDAQERWPYGEGVFDGVLFVNVLEHLYDYRTAVTEARRVLKPGGVVAGVVPFMFNVHGSPNDYYRYTRTTLELMFKDAGFDQVTVEELGTGAFSVMYHCGIGFARWDWLASLLMSLAAAADRFLGRVKPDNKMSAHYMPLGYYFKAKLTDA